MKGKSRKFISRMALATVVSTAACATIAVASPRSQHSHGRWQGIWEKITSGRAKGQLLSGDFHQHTLYTDGSTSFFYVMAQNNKYDLDWWANSEHGGSRTYDGNGVYWDAYDPNPIEGIEKKGDDGHQVMYRWQSLRDYVYPQVAESRLIYPKKRIFSGLEWNVPGHEHCSTAIVAEDASAISAFEYQFDKSDSDTSRTGEETPFGTLVKANTDHDDAVSACAWMQEQYDAGQIDNAWVIFAHIERKGTTATGGYDINDFRDLNNAGPEVCYGFEGAPGHQVNPNRGFGNSVTCDANGNCSSKNDVGFTYGGVGSYTAKVGGLWDALLGEGRRWFNFANSDYHLHYTMSGDDFFPGEYQKTWVYAVDQDHDGEYSLNEIADGMRSGNAFFVFGDLINHLEFEAQSNSRKVPMGGELDVQGKRNDLTLTIKFKSPDTNNCKVDDAHITSCAAPVVDHVDLIAGDITGKIKPTDADYSTDVNSTTKVIATFDANSWQQDEEGNNVIVYHVDNLTKSMYFRLRGTNIPAGTANETDADGNPLPDALVTINTGIDGAQEAWNDLWFYSNPIFVYVNK